MRKAPKPGSRAINELLAHALPAPTVAPVRNELPDRPLIL